MKTVVLVQGRMVAHRTVYSCHCLLLLLEVCLDGWASVIIYVNTILELVSTLALSCYHEKHLIYNRVWLE